MTLTFTSKTGDVQFSEGFNLTSVNAHEDGSYFISFGHLTDGTLIFWEKADGSALVTEAIPPSTHRVDGEEIRYTRMTLTKTWGEWLDENRAVLAQIAREFVDPVPEGQDGVSDGFVENLMTNGNFDPDAETEHADIAVAVLLKAQQAGVLV